MIPPPHPPKDNKMYGLHHVLDLYLLSILGGGGGYQGLEGWGWYPISCHARR